MEFEDEEKADFKIKAKQFVKIYAQLACIMPFYLSTYGLEWVKLKESIGLDVGDSQIDPQNPNVRGVGPEGPVNPLDEIIRTFNERWFSGWDATPEEQRVKCVNIAKHVMNNPNFQSQVVDNQDEQNSRLAFEKMISQAVSKERKRDLVLYKRYAQDSEFKRAFDASIMRFLSQNSNDVVQKEFIG